MHILVVGGTGLIGQPLVHQLLAKGHRVSIFSRGTTRPSFWPRIDHIPGDRQDPNDVLARLSQRRFDAVVDNWVYDRRDAAVGLRTFSGSVGRYVVNTSAIVYLTGSFTQPLKESDVSHDHGADPRQVGNVTAQDLAEHRPYILGKLRAERVLLESPGPLPRTLIRAPTVLGPLDDALHYNFYLQRLLDGGPVLLLNGGSQTPPVVYAPDLAWALAAAAQEADGDLHIYNIAQESPWSLKRLLECAANHLGIPLKTASLSPGHGSLPHYCEPWGLRSTVRLATAAAKARLGFAATPQERWVPQVLPWYLEHGSRPDLSRRQQELDLAAQLGQ